MTKYTKYQIVEAYNRTDIEAAVESQMYHGWVPLGGISIMWIAQTPTRGTTYYAQAMVLENKEPHEPSKLVAT